MGMQGVLEEVTLLQEITEACRAAVRAFVEERTDKQGRVSVDALAGFARSMRLTTPAYEKALKVCTPRSCRHAACSIRLQMALHWVSIGHQHALKAVCRVKRAVRPQPIAIPCGFA